MAKQTMQAQEPYDNGKRIMREMRGQLYFMIAVAVVLTVIYFVRG